MVSRKPRAVELSTPAKLNLFLELHGRRDDGFHELETIMIAINRYDRLSVDTDLEGKVQTQCRWLPSVAALQHRYGAPTPEVVALPGSEENLVTRALQELRKRFSLTSGFRVTIDKSIPSGAGMGGASSDAAAALLAAADLSGVDRRDPGLIKIAADLGSDVPFFFGSLDGSSSGAFASGRGEKITPLLTSQLHFVVVHPPDSVSTKQVYETCSVPPTSTDASEILAGLALGDPLAIANQMLNRLTEPARRASTWIDRVLHAFARTPVLGYQMTGSGSACFGICRTAAVAQRIARRLQGAGLGIAFAAKSIRIQHRSIGIDFSTPG